MSQFLNIKLNFREAERQLAQFQSFLHNNKTFSEKQVVKELREKLHLSCLIGAMSSGVWRANVYKFEFQIMGVFKADLVVGNSQQKQFVFVEFESGEEHSLFGPKKTFQMRDWSQKFEHGFGQLVDWAWAIRDAANTQIFENAFGCDEFSAEYLLVCGRDSLMDETEQKRHAWRSRSCMVGGKQATCLTYDGLLTFFQTTIEAIKSYDQGALEFGRPPLTVTPGPGQPGYEAPEGQGLS
jgi:hypothetical protein